MKSNLTRMASIALLGAVITSPSVAGEVNLNGFIRSAYDISSSSAKFVDTVDDKGDWGGTQAGLTYATNINEQWSVAGQLHFRATEGELNIDWAFAAFQLNESNKIQFGRQKYPLGLVSENIDIGITYPWVRPPHELYHTEVGASTGNFVLEGYDGLSWVFTTGDEWEFTAQPFVGQYNYKEVSAANLREMLGLKLEASSDILTLQAGYNNSKLTVSAGPTDQSKTTINFGAMLDMDNFLVYLEYADTEVDNSDTFDSNAGYLSLAYTINKYQPYIVYAQLEGQKAAAATIGNLDQDSVAIGLAYHYNPSTVFKAQWKNIKPDDPTTAGMVEALPAGETSVDILSLTMDIVF